MKKLMSLLTIALFSAVLFSCGDDPEPEATDLEQMVEALGGGWTASSAMVPDETATTADDWTSVTINITAVDAAAGTVEATVAGSPAVEVLPNGTVSGTVTASSPTSGTIDLGVGSWTAPANCEISGSNATFTFTVADGTEAAARVAALGGQYSLTVAPQ